MSKNLNFKETLTLNGKGKLYSNKSLSNRTEYNGFRLEFTTELIKYLVNYTNAIAENIKDKLASDTYIWYGERQLTTPIILALNKISDACISELPVKRDMKDKRFKHKKLSGRIDYWALYQNTDYYMEVKHFMRKAKSTDLSTIINAFNDDADKLTRTVKHINDDRLIIKKDPKCLLVHSVAIHLKQADYEKGNDFRENCSKILGSLSENSELNYDEIFLFEFHENITNRVWSGSKDNRYVWPYLLIGFKNVHEKKAK